MCDCLSREFKVTVYESRNARYVGYPVDDVANLVREPPDPRSLRKGTYFDHGQIPIWFYPFLEVYQREWDLFPLT